MAHKWFSKDTSVFTAATRNPQEDGERTGVQRMVVVSIIGCDRFTAGYLAAKPPTSGPIRWARSRYVFCVRRSSTSSSRN